MSDINTFQDSHEDLAAYSLGNLRWLALAAIAFCREREIGGSAFWDYTGRLFAPTWDQVKSSSELLSGIITNLRSMGFELVGVSGDEHEYTVRMSGWPSEEELQHFQLTSAETDGFLEIFVPIADYVAHDFSWRRDGNAVVFTLTRR